MSVWDRFYVVAEILATAAAKAADLAVKHSDGEPTKPTLVTPIVFAEAGE